MVLGAFLVHLPVFGTVYTFTVLFNPIKTEFAVGTGAVAWISSIAIGFFMGSQAITGRLSERFGARPVVLVGAVLLAGGFVISAQADTMAHLYLSFGVIVGCAQGCVILPALSVVSRRFTAKRGMAIGFATAGSGVASLAGGPIVQRLVDGHGWRGSLQILAVSHFALLVIGALMLGAGRATARRSHETSPWRDKAFRVLYRTAFFAAAPYFIPFLFIVPYAKEHDISTGNAAALVSLMGAASIAGRISLGTAADRFGAFTMYRLSLGLMGLTLAVWPLVESLGPLAVFAAVFAFSAGSIPTLFPAVAGDYFGAERMASAAGLLGTASAVGSLLGPPAAGWLVDRTGSYTTTALSGAAIQAVALLMTFGMPPRHSQMCAETLTP